MADTSKRVNKVTGKEVARENIVKGLEYQDGQYVVLSAGRRRESRSKAGRRETPQGRLGLCTLSEVSSMARRPDPLKTYKAKRDFALTSEPSEAGAASARAALPDIFEPELATLVDAAPADAESWNYEIKFDGCRLLARIRQDGIALLTRQGRDWTARLAHLHQALEAMRLPEGWYDGEIVVLDSKGVPDFQALQGAFDSPHGEAIVYYLFDLPFCAGRDLRSLPLTARRRRLQRLLEDRAEAAGDTVRFSNSFEADARIAGKAHWVRPELLAEVSFSQWTRSGRIRHSVFHGLRSDKPAQAIIRETRMPIRHSLHAAVQPQAAPLGRLKITHPQRIVDKSTGTTKIDIVRYYGLVAPLMLEHLKGRPVSLVRAPDGVGGEMFFQKHLEEPGMPGVRSLPQELDPGHAPLMEISSAQGLLSAAQMNVIEFHTWNGVRTRIDRPDRMAFDLDPGKGVPWAAMQEAALVMHDFLRELELACFVKTSGGKGLHVVVPLQRRHDWNTVKDFSHCIVLHLATALPKRFSAKSGPDNRVGRIFIDYLRNGFGATTAAAWSARARPAMGVSVPVAWDEVEKLQGAAQWHIGNIHERLDRGNAPWEQYRRSARPLARAMKRLGFEPRARTS